MVLGGISAEFIRRGAYHDLGFVRLNDYTRERLGICAGEMRTAARVAQALALLPASSDAFRCGEVNWTKLRTITTVADASTEAMWLRLAKEHTAENLRQLAKAARDPATLQALVAAHGDSDDRALQVAGSVLATSARNAAFPAASLDADPDPDTVDGEPVAFFRLRCPLGVLHLWRRALELASCFCGEELATWRAAEAIAAEGLAAKPPRENALARLERGAAKRAVPARHRSAAAGVGTNGARLAVTCRPHGDEHDSGRMDVSLSSEIARLAIGLEDAPAAELDRRARITIAAMQRVDYDLGALLRVVLAQRLYEQAGFRTFSLYVTNRLGLCLRKARTLVALDRRTRFAAAPQLMCAYRDGDISCARAILLMQIISGPNAEPWIQRAQEVTFRQLRAEVDWARERFELCPTVPVWPPPPDADLEGVHIGDAQQQTLRPGGSQGTSGESTVGATLSTAIQFSGPASIVTLFEAAIDAFTTGPEPRWLALSGLLEHVISEWEAQPRHRDPIFERDGWRCTVPACTSRRNLHDHHVDYRSRGGDNSRLNRTAVCAGHHQRDIHQGHLRAERKPSGEIEWWLGIGEGAGGRAFLHLLGDRYLTRQSLLSASGDEHAMTIESQRRKHGPLLTWAYA